MVGVCAARKVSTTGAKMRGAIDSFLKRREVALSNFPDYCFEV